MFRHTFILTWMNNIIDMHSAVEKCLFWGNIRKEQYSLLVGKQVIVAKLKLEFQHSELILEFRHPELESLHSVNIVCAHH